MSKTNPKQLFQLQSVLFTNAEGIEDLDQALVQKILDRRMEAGRDFMAFLRNGGKVIVGDPRILKIDRSTAFNPAKLFGGGWSIWKGPVKGDGLKGEEDQDPRSLAITELDVTKVVFVDMLEKGESSVNGEEKQKRLVKAGHVPLDAMIFQTLWQNQALIPTSWKGQGSEPRYIFFDGTKFRGRDGKRYIRCLCLYDGKWATSYYCLNGDMCDFHLSAVLMAQ